MIAYNILGEREIEIPDSLEIKVGNSFKTNDVEYIIITVERCSRGITRIEVMRTDEFAKRHTVKMCADGVTRTLKEIEDMEKEKLGFKVYVEDKTMPIGEISLVNECKKIVGKIVNIKD